MSIVWFGGAYSGGAASAAIDWDTYENGVWQESPNHATNSQYTSDGYTKYGATRLKSPTTNASTWGDYIFGWWSYSARPTAALSVGYTLADADPYVAVWDCVLGQWLGVDPFVGVGSNRAIYDDGVGNRLFADNLSSRTNTCIFVPLTADPGDISGWRDYDGPDDWDTWEDGIAAIDMDPISGINGYFYPKNVKDSTNYEVPLRARANSLTEFQINKFDNSINGGALENPPPYIALWWERTGSQVVRTWFVAKLKDGSVNTYEFVEAANGQVTFHVGSGPTGQFAIVNLSRKPNDLSNWRDYDGPLFASWDEPARHTLVSAVDQVSSSVVDVEYYEDTSFWSSIVQNSPGTAIPGTLSRDAVDRLTMNNASGSSSMNNGTFTSLVPKAAIHMANYTSPYNGWLWSTPSSTNTFQQSYPFTVSSNLNFNNFYTYAPMVLTLYSEEIGDIRYWPAYDGPVANWDTYANGVYIVPSLTTSVSGLTSVPSYSSTTYTDGMTTIRLVNNGSGFFFPENANYTANYDGNEPPYIAIYMHEYADDVENDYSSNAKGWYVFKNDTPSSGAFSRTSYETPIAWPSDTSTSNPVNINDDGYLGSQSGSDSGFIVVFLDEYNDPVGSGGTDHWTKPPIVIYGTVNNVDTASDRVNSNDLTRYGQAPGVDVYTINPIRIDSNNVDGQWIVNAQSPALGVLDTQVFLNGTKISEAPWTHSGQGTGSPRVPIDFSTTGIYSNWTDFETNSGITAGDELMLVIYND